MKYLVRFLLLTLGFTLVTTGLAMWQHQGFSFTGIYFFDNNFKPHPVHVLILGISMIPPALWEIFLLDNQHSDD